MTARAPRASESSLASVLDVPIRPPLPHEWTRYLATHGRSFSFASILIPEPYRSRVIAVYAYCRYTDDLVDRGRRTRGQALAQLDYWLDASEAAYRGEPTEHEMLRVVMGDMAAANVPFQYAAELIRGMRMDVMGHRYHSMDELRVFCYRVASVVGLWLTELFGVHDSSTLERASRLGIAMQLTNIIRDVGEDWSRGRLYLPRDVMRACGLTTEMIDGVRQGIEPMPRAYIGVVQQLMAAAEADYAHAWPGIGALPEFFRPGVAVAARAYAAIHEAIRENNYDTLRLRASTSATRKLAIARATLRELGLKTTAFDRPTTAVI
jgi:phytoene synthase